MNPGANQASGDAVGVQLPKQNDWEFTVGGAPNIPNRLFATIRNEGQGWVVTGVFHDFPDIPVSSKDELFVVSPDLKHWASANKVPEDNCPDIKRMNKPTYKNLCSSALAKKQTNLAGAFIVGVEPIAYVYELGRVVSTR
ncbi:hypothetical protein [Ralstonia insidiosa]|uniref:Uncharacterized protein n=1 Tax=Ralstonia insidiosa TaxID=190721 RepID=A0A848P3U2_9RALS|nr:hypothetical protein [Ralstonia insidiosa]NMV41962.1 hypothetical protein [Ralstonia insidiosa]